MQKNYLIGLLLLITSSNVSAQTNNHRFHYPLDPGDFWEYEKRSGFSPSVFTETREVIEDTLMPNGKTYKLIERTDPISVTKMYQRIDSSEVFQLYEWFHPPDQIVYDEFLLYNLDLTVGLNWPYPPNNYHGFISDSGFVEVRGITDLVLWQEFFGAAALGSFTLPDTGLWFDPDVILVDSIGVLEDSFEGGSFQLVGAIINGKQYGTITSVESHSSFHEESEAIKLRSYPNPFNNSTTIAYDLDRANHVAISIFNVLGEKVKTLTNGLQQPGSHAVSWRGDNDFGLTVSSGTYFFALTIGGVRTRTERLTIAK